MCLTNHTADGEGSPWIVGYWVSLAAALSGGNTPGASFSALRIFVNTLRDSPASVGGLTGLTRSRSGLPRGGAWNDSTVKVIGWESLDPVLMEGVAGWDGQAQDQMMKRIPGESAASLDDEILSLDTRPSRSTAGVPARGGGQLLARIATARLVVRMYDIRHLTPLFCDAPTPNSILYPWVWGLVGRSLNPSTTSYTSSLRTKFSTLLWAGTRLWKWKDTLEHPLSTHIPSLTRLLHFSGTPGSQGLQTPGVQQRRAAMPTRLDSGKSCYGLVDPWYYKTDLSGLVKALGTFADVSKGNTSDIRREGASQLS
ncbi:hypothetical protein JB92DRAFT_2826249 [Gautieria morchelliformis]|nr:hypothetical protein JB92DRAFT_2826249 [Gautieria morchelliformis]